MTSETRHAAAQLRLAARAYRNAQAKSAAKPASAKRARKLALRRDQLAASHMQSA